MFQTRYIQTLSANTISLKQTNSNTDLEVVKEKVRLTLSCIRLRHGLHGIFFLSLLTLCSMTQTSSSPKSGSKLRRENEPKKKHWRMRDSEDARTEPFLSEEGRRWRNLVKNEPTFFEDHLQIKDTWTLSRNQRSQMKEIFSCCR